jgi:hypothetical protein
MTGTVVQTTDKEYQARLAAPLTASEEESLRQRLIEFEQQFGRDGTAKYRIEVQMARYKRRDVPFPGFLTVWERGSVESENLIGTNMTHVFFCPGSDIGKNNCTAIIPDAANAEGLFFCPACKTSWNEKQVITERWYRLPVEHWATVLTRVYTYTHFRADVYLKWYVDPVDIRAVTHMQKEGDRYGKNLRKLRLDREKRVIIYPQKNIIKDTSAGASLYNRMKALLLTDATRHRPDLVLNS